MAPRNLTIVGTAAADTLLGGDGHDTISGGAGNDLLVGGAGNDRLNGEDGNDRLDGGLGNDRLDGGAGNDTLVLSAGNDHIDGGTGQDTLDASSATAAVSIDLSAGRATGMGNTAITGIEDAIGSAFDDTLTGNASANVLRAGAGNDTLNGGAGDDTLFAGSGNDTLLGGAGSDVLVYNATAAVGFAQAFDGGTDSDTLRIELTAAQFTRAVLTELVAYQNFLADPANAGASFQFSALGNLTTTNVDTLQVLVDGVATTIPLSLNEAPVVDAGHTTAALAVAHNHAVTGRIAATDVDGDALAYSVQTGPAHGTVTFTDAAGNYTYTAGDHVGADSFVLQVSDGRGGIVTQTVTVDLTNTVATVNAAATTQTFMMVHGETFSGQIAATDAEGDALSYSLASGPAHGTVTFTDSNGHYTYTADDFAGTDSFVLEVSDGHGGVTTHTVTVGIHGTIDASAAAGPININLSTDTGTGVDAAQIPYGIDVIGSVGNDVVYGDARANTIHGGAGKDELHGLAGNDRITGGLGDDRMFGEDGDDDLDAGDGNDSLNGGANKDVMRGGIGNDTLYGGGDSDRLYGNEGDDKLYGDGGADTMTGGVGNDIYQADNAGDQVVENAGEGTDMVQAFLVGHTLAANVENLTLMGTAAIGGTGNTGNNVITGNTANNLVNGGGGADTLTGGGGNDTFAWARAVVTTATGLDHVTDFGAGDRLDFSAVFSNTHPTNVPAVLRAADTAAGTVISADNGAGAFVDLVVLDGVHTTLDDLLASSQIVV